jgi:bifunctional DNase/RNase
VSDPIAVPVESTDPGTGGVAAEESGPEEDATVDARGPEGHLPGGEEAAAVRSPVPWAPDDASSALAVALPEESPAGGAASPADFRMALVSSVTVDLPNQHPTVVLRETESPRRHLSFSIGLQDGIVLSHALRRIPTPRPLTHELMSSVLQNFDIDVVAVRLVGRRGAVYFAELDLRGRSGHSVLSCRPSDGLAVALLQPVTVPILIDHRLFEATGDVTPPGLAVSPA